MGKADVSELCVMIELAIKEARDVRRRSFQICDMMESLWFLQDSIARLVEAAHDHRAETFEVIDRRYPTLIKDVFDLLTTSRDFHKVSGVQASCTAINDSLLLLEYLKEESRSVVELASAAGGH